MADLDPDRVAAELETLGWRRLSLPVTALGTLGLLVQSSVAVAAVVTEPGQFRVAGAWRDCQTALADLVSQGQIPREKDRYLVFLVQALHEDDIPELARALADTHVARKLCIELGSAPLGETLAKSVILGGPRIVEETSSVPTGPVVPESVLEQLTSKAPEKILDALLAGELQEEEQ